jgi:hypothetical protein
VLHSVEMCDFWTKTWIVDPVVAAQVAAVVVLEG